MLRHKTMHYTRSENPVSEIMQTAEHLLTKYVDPLERIGLSAKRVRELTSRMRPIRILRKSDKETSK